MKLFQVNNLKFKAFETIKSLKCFPDLIVLE